MNILIVGLGLIGGSYAKGLKAKGHTVYGVDINEESLNFALANNIIDFGSQNPEEFIGKSELIIIGLYPNLILEFLNSYRHLFKENQLITDVCGVKTVYVKEAYKLAYPATYLAHHPMAGREKTGILYSNTEMFKKANFLICNSNHDQKHIDILKSIANDLEFGRITVISPEYHDKMIGFTSQLTHAIAVSLVNSDTEEDTKSFIGDSYRDLTRIAMINEELWSELFLANKEYLIGEISNFECELKKLKNALLAEDKDTMKKLFIASTKKRKEME